MEDVRRRMGEKAFQAVVLAAQTGAGLLLDGQLREFLVEYNNRLAKFGLDYFPSSMNVLRAFFTHDVKLRILRLLPEKDHLLSFSDFVDFATSADAPADPFAAAYFLEDGVIYSYNSLDDPHDLTFQADDGAEYGIGGVSIVRHGDEVSVMLVGGRIADLGEVTEALERRMDRRKDVPPSKVQPAFDLEPQAVSLCDQSDMWKQLALARFDLATRTQEVRFLLSDDGDSYDVASDDPTILRWDDMSDDEARALLGIERLDAATVLFEIAKTAILLPSYFRFKITLIKNESRRTCYLEQNLDGISKRKAREAAEIVRRQLFFPINDNYFYRSGSGAGLPVPPFSAVRGVWARST